MYVIKVFLIIITYNLIFRQEVIETVNKPCSRGRWWREMKAQPNLNPNPKPTHTPNPNSFDFRRSWTPSSNLFLNVCQQARITYEYY